MTQETAVEISDEVVDVFHQLAFEIGESDEAGTGYDFSMEQFDEFVKASLQSTIPLVVESLVAPLSHPCARISLDDSLCDLWEDGYRKALEDILAKVKK